MRLEHRMQATKTNKNKILSSFWVLDAMKWFKRCGVKELLELSGDAMKYVIIEDRLLEALKIKCKMLKCQNWKSTLQIETPKISPNTRKSAKTYPMTSHYLHEPWPSESLNISSNLFTQVRRWGNIMASSPKYGVSSDKEKYCIQWYWPQYKEKCQNVSNYISQPTRALNVGES